MPTAQEEFWKGAAGDAYTARNDEKLLPAKTAFFSRALMRADGIKSAIEFGANRGLNLQALRSLNPQLELAAVEINPDAVRQLVGRQRQDPNLIIITLGSMLEHHPYGGRRDASPDGTMDLAFTMGVLIHIAPNDLPRAYDALHRASSRYILIGEYFSRQPVEIEYRGEMGRLWKRDFAAEILDRHKDLKLIDYGFVSRLDPVAPLDDIHWWLLEKAA